MSSLGAVSRLPQFFELELCGKDGDKQNVHVCWSLTLCCDWTSGWDRMSGGWQKQSRNWLFFLNWGAWAGKIASKHRVFYISSSQNTANTSVSGWFALGAGNFHKSEENTRLTIHLEPLVEKHRNKKTVLSTHSLTHNVNSRVLEGVHPWCCKSIVNTCVLVFQRSKNAA